MQMDPPKPPAHLPLRAMAAAQLLVHGAAGGFLVYLGIRDPEEVVAVWMTAGLVPGVITALLLGWLAARAQRKLVGAQQSRMWAPLGAFGFTAVSASLPVALMGPALIAWGLFDGRWRWVERSLVTLPVWFVVALGLAALWIAAGLRSAQKPMRDAVTVRDTIPTSGIMGAWVASLAVLPAIPLIARLQDTSVTGALVWLAMWAVGIGVAGLVAQGAAPHDRPDAAALRLEAWGAVGLGALLPLFAAGVMPLWASDANDARWLLLLGTLVVVPVSVGVWSMGRVLRQELWLPE